MRFFRGIGLKLIAFAAISPLLQGCFNLALMTGDTLYGDRLEGSFVKTGNKVVVEIRSGGTNNFKAGNVKIFPESSNVCTGQYLMVKEGVAPFGLRVTSSKYSGQLACGDGTIGSFDFVVDIGTNKGAVMDGKLGGDEFHAVSIRN